MRISLYPLRPRYDTVLSIIWGICTTGIVAVNLNVFNLPFQMPVTQENSEYNKP